MIYGMDLADRERIVAGGPALVVKAVFFAALLLHLLFIVSLPTGLLNSLFVEAKQGYGQASDLFGIYQAGANLRGGYSIYDRQTYRNEAPAVVPFSYFYRYLPPTAYGAAFVTLILQPRPAYWVWISLNEILIALVVISILRWRALPAGRRWLAASLWLGFFPVYIEQFMGQFSLCMAVLLFVVWRLDDRAGEFSGPALSGREWGTGILREWRGYSWRGDRLGSRAVLIAWSASLVLKSFSILLALPYLRDRLLKRVLAGVGLAAALCLPYFAFRPEDFWEFVKLNLSPSSMIYKGAFGFQAFLRGLVWHMPSAWTAPSFEVLGWKLDLEGIVLIIFSVAFLILSVRATVNFHNRPGRRALDLLLWTTLFLLVFKSVWEYHYVMILPALTAAYLVTGSRVVLVLGALLGLPTLFAASTILAGVDSMAPLEEWPGWFRVLHFGVKSLPTLGLFIWCLLRGANPYRSPRRV